MLPELEPNKLTKHCTSYLILVNKVVYLISSYCGQWEVKPYYDKNAESVWFVKLQEAKQWCLEQNINQRGV